MVYDSGFTQPLLPNVHNRIGITMFVLWTYADRKLWHTSKLDKMCNMSENIKTLNMKDFKINCTVKIVLNFKIIIYLKTSIPNLIIRMNVISTLVWFLITFIYTFFSKLKLEYIIIIFFHLIYTYDSQVYQIGHFQFAYIVFLLYSIYLLLVFPNSVRDTTHHVAYGKGLGATYSTASPSTMLLLWQSHSCPWQYHFHTSPMSFSKHTCGLALCLKYLKDFSLLLANS